MSQTDLQGRRSGEQRANDEDEQMTSQTLRGDDLHVVVIGAGYAGMIATNRFLGSLTEDEKQRTTVTVVNPRPVFVERIRLHQLAAGTRDTVTIPLTGVLHPDAIVVEGQARLIDPVAKTVRVATASAELTVTYDYLVYAVGSVAAASIPGAVRNAFLLADYDGACRAAEAIGTAGPTARIAVVGGGLTGVEAAGELAEQHPSAVVTLYCAGPLVPGMRPAARRSILKALRRVGVRVEQDAAVAEVDSGALRLESGPEHAFDVCILAASFAPPDLASVSGLPVDPSGRLRVDEQLRCLGRPTVIGAGDAIVAPDAVASHLRMGCAVALPLGAQAAETLLASIHGTVAPVLSIGFVVQCISLGRKKGYIQAVRSDDTPRALRVGGRWGAMIKERICRLVVEAPTKESIKPGAYSWPKGPKRTPAA
jgi:NADH:ubiquinone reductase (H+-translocating)